MNQTAYRSGVGCTDAIFATQETIVREGSAVHMCLYDLQKALDSVEFPVLLDHLFSMGVNGKTWRIIKSWYEGGSCCVKVEDRLSNAFPVQRGVRQGSILSPTMFLLVMDPLLKKLEMESLGLKINDLYVGGLLMLTNSTSSLNAQLEAVSSFTTENFLQLNLSKCEIVSFSRQSNCAQPQVSLDGATLQCKDVAKCLVYVWNSTLSSKPMIEHNITKARRFFFANGSIGAYQGNISPLSCRSVIETCVMLILLYGCESWSLCDSSLKALYSNTTSMIVMDCQPAEARCLHWAKNEISYVSYFLKVGISYTNQVEDRAKCPTYMTFSSILYLIGVGNTNFREVGHIGNFFFRPVLIRKLCFLHRITNSSDTLSLRTLEALSDDIESVCLIRECLELEERLNVNLTHSFLTSNLDLDMPSMTSNSDLDMPSVTQIKRQATSNNWSLLLG